MTLAQLCGIGVGEDGDGGGGGGGAGIEAARAGMDAATASSEEMKLQRKKQQRKPEEAHTRPPIEPPKHLGAGASPARPKGDREHAEGLYTSSI